MSDYTPREGSVAHRVIEFLKTQEPGAKIGSDEVAAKFDCTSATTQVRKAIDSGLLAAEKIGQRMFFSLPAEPKPTDGPLTIATWSDGDVMVSGGQLSEDGSVVYTRQQAEQLVKHLTQPHVDAFGGALTLPLHQPV